MVSYDDTIEEKSPLDFDDYTFSEPEDEYNTPPVCEDQETLVGSDMDVETTMVPGMELDIEDQGVAPSQVFDMEPMLEAVHTPMPRRSPSPDSSGEESEATLYNPTPSPRLRSTRARLARKDSQMTMFSRSPTPLVKREASPAPSSFSAISSVVKVKVERKDTGQKKARKRSSNGGRKGEPRRCQNMIAQKKYRDKKVHASALMSDTIVDIKAVLKFASPQKRLDLISALVGVYDANMNDLDPNLASKQDQAVKDQASRYQ